MADDLFDSRLTEHRNPNSMDIDRADAAAIVDLINAEDRSVPEAVHGQRESIARAIELAVEAFRSEGRLIYVGAGTSGRLGVLDATECPPTFGVDPDRVQGIIAGGYMALVRSQEGAEDRSEDGAAAMDDAGVDEDDFVLGIAASSTTAYVRGALERAAELGARTGILCCTEPGEETRRLVDVAIVPLVGPEVIAGSTRMKAGTATKLVLNSISTGAMILLGKVYENLMVDLQAVSEKLVDRGERIVMAVTEASREEARAVIEAAGGSVKTALVMKKGGVRRELAEIYLAEARGRTRQALDRVHELEEAAAAGGDLFTPHPSAPPDGRCIRLTLDALRKTPKLISQIFSAVADADRLSQPPKPGQWSAKEVVEHLIVFDRVVDGRLRAMLAEEDASLPNWDEEVENPKIAASDARDSQANLMLMRLADGRARMVARVEGMGADQLTRTARHEVYGEVSVYQVLRQLAWHDDHHLQALEAMLAG